MGNQLCCDQTNKPISEIEKLQDLEVVSKKPEYKKEEGHVAEVQIFHSHGKESTIKHQSVVHVKEQSVIHPPVEDQIELPKHSLKVLSVLARVTPGTVDPQKLESLFKDITVVHRKKYGTEVYEGEFDHHGKIPHGLGKMHKADGSLFLGYFSHGKANGNGVYIFSNGSFYSGEFNNNIAVTSGENKGYYQNEELKYTGGFKDNTFHGLCHEIGKDHSYEGEYSHGVRSNGTLKWSDNEGNYQYTGTFNSKNNFEGKGILIEPKGVYEGEFKDGDKHGEGFYKAANGTKYRGSYVKNKREGKGTIFNNDDSIAYRGELKNGLPHGEGEIVAQDGFKQASWIQGIDASLIEE